tara:strand:+ start:6813 stop:7667 length:855 start_codon:yes stop_codon:yes gene_type:complete
MSEEDTGTTANLSTETPTETTAENTEVSAEGTPSIDNYKDEYDQRVDALLAEYEAQKNGTPPPPKEKLREGESWDSLFEQADENSQRAMRQLRADYTRKTQELANQRKELDQQRQELQALQANLQDNAAFKAIKEAAEADAGEFDPFDNDSFQRYVNKMVAEKLQAVLQPMAEQQMRHQAQTKIQSFMTQHPELKTDDALRTEVRQTLESNEGLSLQDAYWIVRGRRSHETAERAQLQQLAFNKAAKASGLKVGIGQHKGITVPKGATSMRAHDLYAHLLKQKK